MNFKGIALAGAILLGGFGAANAATVTFSGLSDFANYSEAGMNMTSNDVWNWPVGGMAHMDGGLATFNLASGGDFILTTVEMVNSGGSGPAFFELFNDGVSVASVSIPGNAGVFSFTGLLASVVDELRVTVPSGHFTFDNLSFDLADATTPVPAALPLFAGGLGLMGFLARRRKQKAQSAA